MSSTKTDARPDRDTPRTDPDSGSDGSGLKRELGLGLMAIYGAGTILGAGIYVLIGEVAGAAGRWMPLAFLVGAAVAGLNGLVFAELSTRSPHAGGPSDYVGKAWNRTWLSVIIGWMIVATGVVSAATIATGFSGYLSTFVEAPDWLVESALLVTIGVVAAAGAKQSAWFMAITTGLGVLGLVAVMWAGFLGDGPGVSRILTEAGSLTDAAVLSGVASAVFLSIYAFIGFEDMVHMAEEVKRPERTMPAAILIAIAVAAVLYALVSVAALGAASPEQLSDAEAPLVAAVEAGGLPGWPVAALSLWIILNGALAQVVMASRVMFQMGRNAGAPDRMGQVNDRTDTPLLGTAAATAVALAFALWLPLKALASVTSFVMLLLFIASSAALVVLERREPDAPFDTPRWLPWVAGSLAAILAVASFFVSGSGH